ncbi:MAG TPA: hypothetical protein VEY92_05675, partial [Pseudoxanthomonas sp.]|nr:hypothetical protein [Pseudoxanthomonas sp.]
MSNEQLEIHRRLLDAGVMAQSAFGQEIIAATKSLQVQRAAMASQVEVMDTIRGAGKDLFMDLANGVRPIDAIGNAWDSVHQKLLS